MYRNKKHIYVITALILISISSLSSQNIKSDVASINAAYNKFNKLSFVFELNMFENYTTNKVYYTQTGIMQKNGNNTFQKFDDTECVNTPDYSVIIDKEDKEVVYAPKKRSFTPPIVSVNLDSVLLFCKSHKYKKTAEGLSCYEFVMVDAYPDYRQITISFDPSNYLIRKIVFYCEEDDISMDNDAEKLAKSRIEINYKNMDTKPAFNNTDFTYEKYLVKNGNKFILKNNFKDYHLTVLSF